MPASYPAAAAAFTTKNDGDTILAAHINALQDEIAAIEATLVPPGGLTGGVPTPHIVSGVRPTLLLDYTGQPIKGRLHHSSAAAGVLGVTENLSNDGTNWVADDTTQASLMLQLNALLGQLNVYSAAAGANPKTLTQLLGIGSNGSITERGRAFAMGEWTNVPFVAADFAANGAMTWTVGAGNVVAWRYTMIGKTVFVQFDVTNTTIGGTVNTQLTIKMPFTTTVGVIGSFWLQNPAGAIGIFSLVTPQTLALFRDATLATAWTLGSTVRVSGLCIFTLP